MNRIGNGPAVVVTTCAAMRKVLMGLLRDLDPNADVRVVTVGQEYLRALKAAVFVDHDVYEDFARKVRELQQEAEGFDRALANGMGGTMDYCKRMARE